jgi:hypothetical protein
MFLCPVGGCPGRAEVQGEPCDECATILESAPLEIRLCARLRSPVVPLFIVRWIRATRDGETPPPVPEGLLSGIRRLMAKELVLQVGQAVTWRGYNSAQAHRGKVVAVVPGGKDASSALEAVQGNHVLRLDPDTVRPHDTYIVEEEAVGRRKARLWRPHNSTLRVQSDG